MMYTPEKLFKIIRMNAVLCAVYSGLRCAFTVSFFWKFSIFIFSAVFVLTAVLGFYLSKNIWLKKGVYFMTFLCMFFLSDIICICMFYLLDLKKNEIFMQLWASGGIGVFSGAGLFFYGFFNEKRVRKNTIMIKSKKVNKPLRFAVMSDIHFGTVQPVRILSNTIERINNEAYDGIILAGDIVEEHTSRESMRLFFPC